MPRRRRTGRRDYRSNVVGPTRFSDFLQDSINPQWQREYEQAQNPVISRYPHADDGVAAYETDDEDEFHDAPEGEEELAIVEELHEFDRYDASVNARGYDFANGSFTSIWNHTYRIVDIFPKEKEDDAIEETKRLKEEPHESSWGDTWEVDEEQSDYVLCFVIKGVYQPGDTISEDIFSGLDKVDVDYY